MPKCQCETCHPEKPGETWTRVHALRCEARMVASLPNVTAHEYLVVIRARRGDAAADLLAQEIGDVYREQKKCLI